jgi:membrane protein implicated in regulation of membrane protease activity
MIGILIIGPFTFLIMFALLALNGMSWGQAALIAWGVGMIAVVLRAVANLLFVSMRRREVRVRTLDTSLAYQETDHD